MANQIVLPSYSNYGAAQQAYPQPLSTPVLTGQAAEGPRTFLSSVTIPIGQLSATLSLNIAQFGLSMVQSVLVDNEVNSVSITVKVPPGVNFGIQPLGSQVIPVFLSGTTLQLTISIAVAQVTATTVALQIFNYAIPPASWVSNLAVSGNVSISAVSGSVNINVTGTNVLGVGLIAATSGGSSNSVLSALSTTVTMIKQASGQGLFKGLVGISGATGWVQLFDAISPGDVTLGTTVPTWAAPIQPINTVVPFNVPPEGQQFQRGLQAAWTTTINGLTAPASAFQGNIFYA